MTLKQIIVMIVVVIVFLGVMAGEASDHDRDETLP